MIREIKWDFLIHFFLHLKRQNFNGKLLKSNINELLAITKSFLSKETWVFKIQLR